MPRLEFSDPVQLSKWWEKAGGERYMIYITDDMELILVPKVSTRNLPIAYMKVDSNFHLAEFVRQVLKRDDIIRIERYVPNQDWSLPSV